MGDHITGGDIYGSVVENSLLSDHAIMLPPSARGTISYLAPKGQYTVDVSKMRRDRSSKNKFIHCYCIIGCCPWSRIRRWNYKVHHETTLGCTFPTSCCWEAFCKLSLAHWSTCDGFSLPVSIILWSFLHFTHNVLYSCVQGGTTAIPGAFGCGKTVISQSLSKYSNSDIIIYVG